MEIREQSGIRALLKDVPIPNMCQVRQKFAMDGIPDVAQTLRQKLDNAALKGRIRPGMRVVMTGSSRQISNMPLILRELADYVRQQGGVPCIIPAMGSHGGATDEGPKELLESYGITELLRLPHRVQHGDSVRRPPARRQRGSHGQGRP